MRKPLTHEFVETEFSKIGYKLLSRYTKSGTLMEFECDKHHTHQISWNKFQIGRRCAHCSGLIRKTQAEAEATFAEAGYTLLSKYTKSNDRLDFICDKGHRHKISLDALKQGQKCAYCTKNARLSQGDAEAEFAKFGYTLLSQYTNAHALLDVICPREHYRKMRFSNFKSGKRCKLCKGGGFDGSLPGVLYYLKFTHEAKPLYKIGITNHSVEKRYEKEPLHYQILMERTFLFGSLAKEEEKNILEKHKRYRYTGDNVLKTGSTELFTKDVLKLDTGKTNHFTCA